MPELGEVEIVRRNLARWWRAPAAEVVVIDPELVRGGDAEAVAARLRQGVPTMGRRGKHLIAAFEGEGGGDGGALIFHFRMTGKIVRADAPDGRFARLSWRVPEVGWLVFKDARRLGHVDLLPPGGLADYAPIAGMGPEPYDVDGPTLRERVGGRGLKHALLDQAVIAGVGNIAVSELFWRLGLPPEIRGPEVDALDDEGWEALAEALPRFFDEVIEAEQADEVRYLAEGRSGEGPDVHVGGGEAAIFDVYGRGGEGCRRCGASIERIRVAGRSSYFCPSCQRAG